MQSALKAGLAYFAAVFSVGVLLGTVRVLVLVPRLGEAPAVAVELPFMLAVSWVVCKRLVARFSVPSSLASRVTMGGLALGLLLTAEVGVSVLGSARSILEHFRTYQTAAGMMGLMGQLAFSLFPVVQSRKWTGQGPRG